MAIEHADTGRTQNRPSPGPRIRRGHRLDGLVPRESRGKAGGLRLATARMSQPRPKHRFNIPGMGIKMPEMGNLASTRRSGPVVRTTIGEGASNIHRGKRSGPRNLSEIRSPIRPAHGVRNGTRTQMSSRVWCMLDTLLVSKTISDALTMTEARTSAAVPQD